MRNRSVPSNPQTHVLFVSVGVAYGGAESYYVKLARLLPDETRILAVVCCSRLADEFCAIGVEVAPLPTEFSPGTVGRYFFALKACQRMILRYRPRIAHLNGQPESYLAVFLRLLGLRILTTRHTPFTDQYLREGSRLPVALKRWMVLFSLRMVDRTICVSDLLRRQLAKFLPDDRLVFLPTWVSDEFISASERPEPRVPLQMLFVGRVVRNKGVFDAITVLRHCPGVELTIVGEGEDRPAAEAMAKGLPVRFLGFQQDCKPFYREADLLVFPSPEGFEGLPQVPLEAMAMGLPCLASNISSVLEIAATRADQPVLEIYEQGNVEDMARRLNGLVEDLPRLRRLSEAGRGQVKQRFTVEAVKADYQRIFAESEP